LNLPGRVVRKKPSPLQARWRLFCCAFIGVENPSSMTQDGLAIWCISVSRSEEDKPDDAK
jgi:hypothetical protein